MKNFKEIMGVLQTMTNRFEAWSNDMEDKVMGFSKEDPPTLKQLFACVEELILLQDQELNEVRKLVQEAEED